MESVYFQPVFAGISLGHIPSRLVRAVQQPSQRGLAAHVAVPVVVQVRVVVRLHLDLDLRHGARHPVAHGHGRGRRARDLQVERDAGGGASGGYHLRPDGTEGGGEGGD